MLELTQIGFSKKPKGIHGHLRLHIEDRFLESLGHARALFFEINGSKVPFLIEDVQMDNQCVVKLDEVDTPEEAQSLISCTIYIENKELILDESDNSSDNIFSKYKNYQVIDQNGKSLGLITDVIEYPSQIMAQIQRGDQTLLWPLHEDNIISTDDAQKRVEMELPEGVEDLFV